MNPFKYECILDNQYFTIEMYLKGIVILDLDLETEIKSKMVKVDQAWRCADCEYSSLKSTNLYRHIESKHVQTQFYTCQICRRSFKGSNSFNVHMYRDHKNK